MAAKFDSKEFKALQAVWYKKLEKSGFKDIEDSAKKGEPLKRWDSTQFQRERSRHSFQANQTYYRYAGSFLENHNFESQVVPIPRSIERQIWEMHSEGQSIRTIAKAMDLKIWFIHRTVRRLKKMALK